MQKYALCAEICTMQMHINPSPAHYSFYFLPWLRSTESWEYNLKYEESMGKVLVFNESNKRTFFQAKRNGCLCWCKEINYISMFRFISRLFLFHVLETTFKRFHYIQSNFNVVQQCFIQTRIGWTKPSIRRRLYAISFQAFFHKN